jgi:cytoskeletal protein RodZ
MAQNNGVNALQPPVPEDAGPHKERVGEILKRERERRQISIEAVAGKLRLNARYIEALEANRYDQLPGDTYIRVYLRSLSNFFSLTSEEILRRFFEERGLTGADTLRKDSSTKINLAAQEEKKSTTPLLVTLAVIALLVISSFIANRPGCHSTRHHKRAETALDTAGQGERGVVKNDAEALPKLVPQSENSQKSVRTEEKTGAQTAPVKQTADTNSLHKRAAEETIKLVHSEDRKKTETKPAEKHAAADTVTKPIVNNVVQVTKDKNAVVSNRASIDSAKKSTPAAAHIKTDTVLMVLRMTVTGDSCWGRVISDGGREWKNTVLRGKGVAFTASDSFNVHVGIGEAVTFTLNGRPLALPNKKGIVTFKVDRSGTVTVLPYEKLDSIFEKR